MWSSRSRRQLSIQRSATPFCQGLSKEVRTGLIFMDRTAPGTSNPYFASRSKIRDRGADWNGNASRSSCTIHRLVGWFVTLKCRMRRRSWLMTKKQQSTPNVIVGTVKKSIAAIASRWFRRKASQRLAGSGSLGARFIQREIVLSERSKPSMRSSPWIRGAPQVGFSATIWKINSRTCFGVRLLPTCVRTLEMSLQYIRKPVRCQRTRVSGVTSMRACFHLTRIDERRSRRACRADLCSDGDADVSAQRVVAGARDSPIQDSHGYGRGGSVLRSRGGWG